MIESPDVMPLLNFLHPDLVTIGGLPRRLNFGRTLLGDFYAEVTAKVETLSETFLARGGKMTFVLSGWEIV